MKFEDRQGDMSGIQFGDGICWKCKHVNPDGLTCKAFPEGIPGEILNGDVKHVRPIKGDRGIQFETHA